MPRRSTSEEFDAVVLCGGATKPRDLPIPGRDLKGIHFAMDFLTQNTSSLLDAHPLALGRGAGGEGNQIYFRQGQGCDRHRRRRYRHRLRRHLDAARLQEPGAVRDSAQAAQRAGAGQSLAAMAEGVQARLRPRGSRRPLRRRPRQYLISTKKFVGDAAGNVQEIHTARIEWVKGDDNQFAHEENRRLRKICPAQLVLVAMGFLGPENQLLEKLGIEMQDGTHNVKAEYGKYQTNLPNVFAAGDMRRGQSLVVWAINEGRGAARECDRWLMGETVLP